MKQLPRIVRSAGLALVLQLANHFAQAQPLSLDIELNQTRYLPGDTLRIKFAASPGGTSATPDLHAGLILPNQRWALFFSTLAPPAWRGRGVPAAQPSSRDSAAG